MRSFAKKFAIFLLPFILFFAIYFIWDPFRVLYHYDTYFKSNKPLLFNLNKDYVSVENFKNKYSTYKYDSYIFGSSKSMHYKASSWQKHINSDKIYHIDGYAETLFGVERKLEFLKKNNVAIKNALLIVDTSLVQETGNSKGLIFIKHPDISGQNIIEFNVEFIKSYCDLKFLFGMLQYKLTHKISSSLIKGYVSYSPVTNEYLFKSIDDEIAKDSIKYYQKNQFANRDNSHPVSVPVIKSQQKELLQKIKAIFNENNTSYKIVISPLYDQKKMNPADVQYLDSLFGNQNVFDFSGVNDITNDRKNYYDNSHYKPFIADKIMDWIYTPNAPQSYPSSVALLNTKP